MTRAAVQPRVAKRAARLPVASKKIGFLLIIRHHGGQRRVPGPKFGPGHDSNTILWRKSGGPFSLTGSLRFVLSLAPFRNQRFRACPCPIIVRNAPVIVVPILSSP